MRLLIAEDEIEMSNALAAILRHHNYSVDTVYDGLDALEWARSYGYDGIILDIMMPEIDGLAVIKRLRQEKNSVPVLLLTAKSQVEDKITGLDAGADDYLSKPFSMGEFLARVRALTRRSAVFTPNILSVADISLDRSTFELFMGENRVRLGGKEFQMMELLMSNMGRLISAERFMEAVWGGDSDTEIGVVWVYVSYLRKKLAVLGSRTKIRSSRGLGYLLTDGEE